MFRYADSFIRTPSNNGAPDMQVSLDPTRKTRPYTVVYDDGRRVPNLSRGDVEGLGRTAGLSIRDAQAAMAQARADAVTAAT